MKIKQDIMNRSLELLQKPEAQKDLTIGDLASLAQIMQSVANAQEKIQKQNQQLGQPDLEKRLANLEARFTRLEDRINAIYEAFAGANDYD